MMQAKDLIATALTDPQVAWSLGSFGAIAEFMWSPHEDGVDDGSFRKGGANNAAALTLRRRAARSPSCCRPASKSSPTRRRAAIPRGVAMPPRYA